jgi:hypothetical protein
LVLIGCGVIAAASPGSAQTGPRTAPDVSQSHFRFGRVMLHPTVALTNLGVDTNVFNEPDQLNPKSDFTLTLTPQTDLWLRMGRSWFIGNVKEDVVWYQTYANQRSVNHSAMISWLVPLNRLTFDASVAYLNTRERPGFEIDARPERRELSSRGVAELRIRPKIFVGVRGDRTTTDYASTAVFFGFNLRDQLNRTTTSEGLTVRHQITPLTALTLDVGLEQQRFEFTPLRDSNSTTASLGVRLDRFALVKGSASVGYRNFQPLSSTLPAYKGPIALASLSYIALGTTQVGLTLVRDIQQSFDLNAPYYLLNGGTLSLARRIFGPVDLVGRAGIHTLAYRNRIAAVLDQQERSDEVRSYGVGIGYHMGRAIRIGFNVDRQVRSSPLAFREYRGIKFGTSVTYGL